jgi:predicted nicotinamide N-methyase
VCYPPEFVSNLAVKVVKTKHTKLQVKERTTLVNEAHAIKILAATDLQYNKEIEEKINKAFNQNREKGDGVGEPTKITRRMKPQQATQKK